MVDRHFVDVAVVKKLDKANEKNGKIADELVLFKINKKGMQKKRMLTVITLDFHRDPSPHVVLHFARFQSETLQSIFSLSAFCPAFDDEEDLASVCEYDCNLLPTFFPVRR